MLPKVASERLLERRVFANPVGEIVVALLPPQYLDTVLALGVHSEEGSTQFSATGFLCGYPSGGTDESGAILYWVYLVTNRHVVQNRTELVVRFNSPLNTGASSYSIPLSQPDGTPSWTLHPSLEVDVAVVRINIDRLKADGIGPLQFINDTNALSIEQACDIGVSEGDGVFVLGFPMGLAGDERNYVIVRQGIIARIQDLLKGTAKQFLIDASVFPGNSGGPVFTKPEAVAIQNTKAHSRCVFLGMVSSYLPYFEFAVSEQTGRRRMMFEENSGLGIVVPYDLIRETIHTAVLRSNTGLGVAVP